MKRSGMRDGWGEAAEAGACGEITPPCLSSRFARREATLPLQGRVAARIVLLNISNGSPGLAIISDKTSQSRDALRARAVLIVSPSKS